jgi:hypothetical protein
MGYGADMLMNRSASAASSATGSVADDDKYGARHGGGVHDEDDEEDDEDAAAAEDDEDEDEGDDEGVGEGVGDREDYDVPRSKSRFGIDRDRDFKSSHNYEPPQPSPMQVLEKKREIMYQFDRLKAKGIVLPREFTLSSSLEEMEMEYERLKKEREIDASVRFQRKMLMAFTSGVEFLNTKFDPLDVKLDGWSENVNENINDYDDIFEELHVKYKRKSSMPPEVRLLMSLVGSGFMFHLTNTMFKSSLPGLDQVLKQNPNLMKQFAGATANMMAKSGNDTTGMSSMFSGMFGGGGSTSPPPNEEFGNALGGQRSRAPPQTLPTMRGPTNIDDILRDLDDGDLINRIENLSTISGSQLSMDDDDNNSVSGIFTNHSGKKSMNI